MDMAKYNKQSTYTVLEITGLTLTSHQHKINQLLHSTRALKYDTSSTFYQKERELINEEADYILYETKGLNIS